MSNLVFPSLPGIGIEVKRIPVYATTIQTATSGKELRGSWWSYPRWNYEIPLNFTRMANFSAQTVYDEMQSIANFFAVHAGTWDSFLFTDPADNTVSTMGFGVGNGSTTAFQLQRCPVGQYQDALGTWATYTTPRTNYLVQSQSFTSSPWLSANATCAGGISDPLGGATAATVTATAANGYWYQQITVASGTYCNSLWIRRRTGTGAIQLWVPGGSGIPVTVTGAWQRFSESGASSGTTCFFGVQFATNGDQVDIAFGQAEPGTVATDYMATTTAAVTVTPNYWPLTGSGFEPITYPNMATVGIYVNGVLQAVSAYTVALGVVTFTSAPAANAVLTWSGSYWKRVRFDQDSLTFEQIVNLVWKGGTIKLASVK